MKTPRHIRIGGRKRIKALTSSLATLGLVAAGAVGVAMAAPNDDLPFTDGVPGPCVSPGPEYPCPTNYPADNQNSGLLGWDNGVNTFVGGNFVNTGGAELEGILVALGDVDLGNYHAYMSAIGSRTFPEPDSVAIVAGGDLSGGAGKELGGQASEPSHLVGYSARYGGSSSASLAMFGDNTVEHLAGIKDHYGDALANLIATSQGIASLPSTGTIQGNKLVGDGTSLVQVFEKSTGVLGPIEFEKIPEGATIIINVPDSGSVDVGTDAMDGYLYPPSSLGNTTINVLWNIPNANSVTIGGTQSIGSFLVGSPESHTTMAAPGSNGRIFVAGDLLQTGNEIHNYPFAGIIPNFEPEPDPAEGTFTIKKEIVGSGADQVPGDTEFEVEYTVNDGDPQTLTIRADGTVVNGPTLKEGDTVGFKELKPDTLEDLLFTRSTITVDGQETDELTITDDGTAEVVVTNTYERQIPLILKKVVQGDNPGDETEYEGNFNVAHDYGGGYGSPFVIKNGEEERIGSVSVGSQVRLTENAIDIPGYTLESAVFSSDIEGAQLIDEGYNFTAPDTDEVLITLTNTFAADQPATGGFSLTKAVDADGDFPANQSFTFDVKIGNDLAQTVVLGSNGTSKVFDEIDDGTQVTISESAPTVSGYEWDGVNYSGTDGITVGNSFTFTIGENDDFEIVATNTFTPEDPPIEPGDVEGTTSVNIDGQCALPEGTTFDINYTVNAGSTQTIIVNPNEGFEIQGLEIDDEVTISVTAPTLDGLENGSAAVQIDGQPVEGFTVGEDDINITITYNYDCTPEPDPGNVPVTGSVNVEGECAPPVIAEFELTYQVDGEDARTVAFNPDGSVALPDFAAGTEVTFSATAPAIAGLENGAVTINGSTDPVKVTIAEGTNSPLTVVFAYDCEQVPDPDPDPEPGQALIKTELTSNGVCELPGDVEMRIVYSVNGDVVTWEGIAGDEIDLGEWPEGTEIDIIEIWASIQEPAAGTTQIIVNGEPVSGILSIGAGELLEIDILLEYDCGEEPGIGDTPPENGDETPEPNDPGTSDEDPKKEPKKDGDEGTDGSGATLPRTGSQIALMALGSLALLAAGGALIIGVRRKGNQY